MRSTGNYVYSRLGSQENKDAYRLAMKDCIGIASSGLENLDIIKTKIEGLRTEIEFNFPKKMFNSRLEEKRAFNMAIDQALNIIDCLEMRFIKGGFDSEPRNYRGKGMVYEDESIF